MMARHREQKEKKVKSSVSTEKEDSKMDPKKEDSHEV